MVLEEYMISNRLIKKEIKKTIRKRETALAMYEVDIKFIKSINRELLEKDLPEMEARRKELAANLETIRKKGLEKAQEEKKKEWEKELAELNQDISNYKDAVQKLNELIDTREEIILYIGFLRKELRNY